MALNIKLPEDNTPYIVLSHDRIENFRESY